MKYTLNTIATLLFDALVIEGRLKRVSKLSRQREGIWAASTPGLNRKSKELAEAIAFVKSKGALL